MGSHCINILKRGFLIITIGGGGVLINYLKLKITNFICSLQSSQPVTSGASSAPAPPGPSFSAPSYQPFGYPGYNQFGPGPVAPPQQAAQQAFNAAPAPPVGSSGMYWFNQLLILKMCEYDWWQCNLRFWYGSVDKYW